MSVANATATVTVNAAFLREIKDDDDELRNLLSEMRHRFQRPIAPGQIRCLLGRLAELRDHLAMHFSLEEAFGYFDDPLLVAPQFSNKAEVLRREHNDLYVQLCSLLDSAERMLDDNRHASLAACLARDYLVFAERLRRHEDQENSLILEAYSTDLGVVD